MKCKKTVISREKINRITLLSHQKQVASNFTYWRKHQQNSDHLGKLGVIIHLLGSERKLPVIWAHKLIGFALYIHRDKKKIIKQFDCRARESRAFPSVYATQLLLLAWRRLIIDILTTLKTVTYVDWTFYWVSILLTEIICVWLNVCVARTFCAHLHLETV